MIIQEDSFLTLDLYSMALLDGVNKIHIFLKSFLVLLSILASTRALNFYKYALQIYLEFSGNVLTTL